MDRLHGTRQKILIVDDSEMNRAILADMLGEEYEIVEAENGEKAVALLWQQSPSVSLVLLDIVMPRMDGFDVLVTHAPAYGLGDAPTLAHRGFQAFVGLMDHYAPQYHLHGHVHLNYDPLARRVRQYQGTTIVNAYEKYVVSCEAR